MQRGIKKPRYRFYFCSAELESHKIPNWLQNYIFFTLSMHSWACVSTSDLVLVPGVFGNFDYAGRCIEPFFFSLPAFYVLKQGPSYYSFLGECCNAVLLRCSINVLWTMKLSPTPEMFWCFESPAVEPFCLGCDQPCQFVIFPFRMLSIALL